MLDKDGLVLWHDYTKDLQDRSGNGHHATQMNTECLTSEIGLLPAGPTGYLTIANPATLKLLQGTWFFSGRWLTGFSGARKMGGYGFCASNGWAPQNCIYSTDLFIVHQSNPTAGGYSLAVSDFHNLKSFCITKTTGSNKGKLFLNGMFKSESTVDYELTDTAVLSYVIGGIGGLVGIYAIENPMYSCLIYNVAKTASQVAAIHKELCL